MAEEGCFRSGHPSPHQQECRVSRGSSVCPGHHFGQSLFRRLREGVAPMKGRHTENASIDKSRARGELQIAPHRSDPVTGPSRETALYSQPRKVTFTGTFSLTALIGAFT